MSPDLEWHVGEEAERETVAKTSPARRTPARTLGLIVIILLGAGLGVVYRSIPDAAPRPSPTPAPTRLLTPTPPAMPADLSTTIEREARALADGDIETYTHLLDPVDTGWRRQKLDAFSPWGRPPDDATLYRIIDFRLRTEDVAWADIRQFRNGRYFRETRFYRQAEGRWYRSDADPSFWSDQLATLDTPHLHAIYAVEDQALAQPVIDQLEAIYVRLCSDLGCRRSLNNCLEALGSMDCNPARLTITYTLKMNSVAWGFPISDDGREIRYPSPRVLGVYEGDQPLDFDNGDMVWLIAWITAQRVAHGQVEIPSVRQGDALRVAIAVWAAQRALPSQAAEVASRFSLDLRSILPLDALWDNVTDANASQMYSESFAVIRFMSQEYGPRSIARLLRASGAAKSFSGAIETALGIRFVEFDQEWQSWLKTTIGGTG